MLVVEPIYCEEPPLTLKRQWNQLLAASFKPNFQMDFDVVQSWARRVRADWKLLILLIRSDHLIVGIVPLMYLERRRRGVISFRRVRFLAQGHSGFSTVLAAPTNVTAVAEAALKWLFST